MLKNDMISPEEAIEEIAAAHLLCFLHPEAEPWPADQMISSNEAAGAALAAAG
jgi:hypothetical protein